jgi:hypothetical protein
VKEAFVVHYERRIPEGRFLFIQIEQATAAESALLVDVERKKAAGCEFLVWNERRKAAGSLGASKLNGERKPGLLSRRGLKGRRNRLGDVVLQGS